MAVRKRATVVMVAERAGVSIASVSRVLNGLATSDDVRARVSRPRPSSTTSPDAVARSLKVGRTNQSRPRRRRRRQPGVRRDDARDRAEVLGAAGYRLVIASTGGDAATSSTSSPASPRLLRRADPHARCGSPTTCRGAPGDALAVVGHRRRAHRASTSTTCAPTPPPASGSPSTTCIAEAAVGSPSSTAPSTPFPGRPARRDLQHSAELGRSTSGRAAGRGRRLHVAAGRAGRRGAARPVDARRGRCANDLIAVAAITCCAAASCRARRRRRRRHGRHRARPARQPEAHQRQPRLGPSAAAAARPAARAARRARRSRPGGSPTQPSLTVRESSAERRAMTDRRHRRRRYDPPTPAQSATAAAHPARAVSRDAWKLCCPPCCRW